MRLGSSQSLGPCGEEPQGKSLWRGMMRACLWIVPILSVVIGLFLLVVQHARFSQAGGKFLASMIYSVLIGMPSAVLLNWVGFHYTERFPRLIVLINTLVLLGTATVGCLAGALLLHFLEGWQYWGEFK